MGAKKKSKAEEQRVRVAIYTRKSVAEGLDQAFSTLDAQRDAVASYAKSMAGEGWEVLDEMYDDGGFSGATTDRPAFQRLLVDIETGNVDAVAVYRLDRLSRSLLDFAQLMRLFEKHDVAFVSISERFDTSTPMGRMVLNLLATFAQFERETIAQRTSDKIQAARRRGMWTGGRPVLGYDVVDRRLAVNEDEAATVRRIFRMYLDLGGCVAVTEELRALGVQNKSWTDENGKRHGGGGFDKNTVGRLLRNVMYRGQVRAGNDVVDGDHEAIVDSDLWERVQRRLDAQVPDARPRPGRRAQALLSGIARCRCGAALTPTSAKRKGRVYAYYVCSVAQKRGAKACPKSRVAAGALEEHVIGEVRRLARSPELVEAAVEQDRVMRVDEQAKLKTEVAELGKARGRLAKRRTALVAAIERDGAPASLQGELVEVDADLAKVDAQRRSARRDLEALDTASVNVDGLRAALAEFDGVWDQLALKERGRLLDLLLDSVTYDGRSEDVEVRFRERPAVRAEEAA